MSKYTRLIGDHVNWRLDGRGEYASLAKAKADGGPDDRVTVWRERLPGVWYGESVRGDGFYIIEREDVVELVDWAELPRAERALFAVERIRLFLGWLSDAFPGTEVSRPVLDAIAATGRLRGLLVDGE